MPVFGSMSDGRRDASSEGAPDFPPHVLREYALIADGERGGLIGPRGDIAWLCAPRWDSNAVFSALIGGPGLYSVTPFDRYVWGGHYEPGTLIWRSRWVTTDSVIECREALALPADSDRLVLLRRIEALDGEAHVDVRLDPRARFGSDVLQDVQCRDGVWSARTGPLRMRWQGAPNATDGGEEGLRADVRLSPGEHLDLVLEMSDNPISDERANADDLWGATEHAWSDNVPGFDDTIAPADAAHSYAVLRGMTSSTGGMVAAVTTSLPERAKQGRNYDYRYVWIRDQALAGQAVAALGPYPLLDDAVRFVAARIRENGEKLAPAYTIGGEPVPDEQRLNLPGYPGGNDIVGNHVNAQFQLDAFGEALMLFAAAAGHGRLDAGGWRAAEIAADAIASRWREEEAGIWELDNERWTESRLICVAGLRAIAAAGPPVAKEAEWIGLAEVIHADASSWGIHPSGRWQRGPDDERLDAALLLPPLRGALPADDPRTLQTLSAMVEELGEDYYLYRFRHSPGPLGEDEGAFLLCGFIMAMAQHQQGNRTEAFRWFERNRAACGPPGLFSEEYDVAQRQLRGNLPQAFVHAMMLEASVRLAQ